MGVKDERVGISGVGAGALLTVFSVLCLVVFAVLSVSTVQAQRVLSEKNAAAVEGYYRADAQSEELLARLRGGEMPEEVQREGDTFRWSSPISDTQCLEVEVLLKEDTYTVLRWQAVSTVEWEQAPGGQVWSGGEVKKEESP